MPAQNLRVGFSATATNVGERGNDIPLTSFSRQSLAITPARKAGLLRVVRNDDYAVWSESEIRDCGAFDPGLRCAPSGQRPHPERLATGSARSAARR
jgi:hypothetical protein